MDEIVNDFLIESTENLDRLDQELVQLESDPTSKEVLASVFRTIHTIKGSCGFLGFGHLEKVAHAGESLLSRLRDGEVALTAEVTSALLAMVDAVRRMLSEIRATESDGQNDYPEVRQELQRLQGGNAQPSSHPLPRTDAPKDEGSTDSHPLPDVNPDREGHNSACATQSPDAARIPNEAAPPSLPSTPADPGGAYLPAPGKMGALLVERGHIKPEELAMALREQDQGDRRRIGEILVTLGVCKPEDVLAAQQFLESRVRETSVETVRVGVNLLDELMNLVGELVLARNQLLQFSRNTKEKRFQNISQRVNLIATKLQDEVMKTRMQQIGSVWNKFPRTVRDLALSCGKEVRLELEGQDTELDRTIIEAIKDPLTHLVRNAIDHGIESPETRKQTGKNPSGVLRLSAFHESGQVNIEIHDDGAGLNGERIRRKAIERGLISQQQASRMIDRDAFNLIFQPGFSTAEKVTNVSGRGVGMDVVKTNVEKIGGTIDIQSVPGQGTTVCVKIPLTLAIIPALMVRCGAERFAIPQVGLTELVRLEGGKGVEWVRGLPVYRLRGRLLPLVSLDQVLRLGSQNVAVSLGMTDPVEGRMDSKTVNLVVLEAAGRQFGLIVNDILNTEEIVVKPLGKLLRGLSAYGGATILGDGTVALILDAKGLAGLAGISTEERASTSEKSTPPSVEQKIGSTDWERLLLAESEAGARFAIPLCQVSHLERFPIAVIQRVGAREVADYGGQILPLLRLSSLFPGGDEVADQHRPSIHVVVCSKGGRTTGLIVGRIVDIVDQTAKLESVDQRRGVMGTCMIDRKMTDVLDVPAIIEESFPAISALSQLSSQSGQGIADMEKIGI